MSPYPFFLNEYTRPGGALMKISNLLVASLVSLITACAATEESTTPLVLNVSSALKPDNTNYQLPFLVQLKNEDGSALANTEVDVSIRYLKYHKGHYIQYDCDGDSIDDCWAIISGVGGSLTAICPAEDSNNNGAIDTGEDVNSNGTLEPNNSAVIAAHPTETPTLNSDDKLFTDGTGSVYFVLRYPQAETGWSQLRITASASIAGSISAESYDFVLPAFTADLTDLTASPPGGNELSIYGTNTSCTTP